MGGPLRKHFGPPVARVRRSGCGLRREVGQRVDRRQEGQGGERREHTPLAKAQPSEYHSGICINHQKL